MSTSHPAELQLLDYVEGSLTGEELRGLRRHVTTCSACQETLRELSHAVDVLERLPTVGIPHDGMRRNVTRNRRKLWMRAVPIFAIVLAAGAIVQELRPTATESNASRAQLQPPRPRSVPRSPTRPSSPTFRRRAPIGRASRRPSPASTRTSPAIAARSSPSSTSTTSRRPARASSSRTGTQQVTVLLVGVEGLSGGVQRETLRPGTPVAPTRAACTYDRALTYVR